MKRREKVKHEGERRSIFLRYLGEVAMAVSSVNGKDRQGLFDALISAAKRKTATADVLLREKTLEVVQVINKDRKRLASFFLHAKLKL
jgi:DNA topoisomerase-6 subunit B